MYLGSSYEYKADELSLYNRVALPLVFASALPSLIQRNVTKCFQRNSLK